MLTVGMLSKNKDMVVEEVMLAVGVLSKGYGHGSLCQCQTESQLQVKEIVEEICHALTIIFRKSLDQGVIPEDWRIANVSPIFKKGSRGKASNYRPVSLTSQVCKIYESILRDAILEHLIKNQLIRESQHGFLRGGHA